MKVVGEYVYTLDDPTTFRRDPSKRQNDPRISELMAIGLDRLVVLERTEQTTKLYEVELGGATNIAGTRWDDAATSPSLEQTDGRGCQDHAAARRRCGSTPPTSPTSSARPKAWRCSATARSPSSTTTTYGIAGGRTQIVVLRGTGIAAPLKRSLWLLTVTLTAPCAIDRARRCRACSAARWNSFELTRRSIAITNDFVGALQHHASASQRASHEASQSKSLWHYGLQFV